MNARQRRGCWVTILATIGLWIILLWGLTMLLSGASQGPVDGRIFQHFAPTACTSNFPLPYIWPQRSPPRVGQPWECLFVTSACPIPDEPDVPMWLVLSFRPPAAGIPANVGHVIPGCWLLVNPDLVLPVPPGFESPPGAILSRTPGRGQVTLRWTPLPSHAGLRAWVQILVSQPGSPAGYVASHAISIVVGS